jgi:hypothetical protein
MSLESKIEKVVSEALEEMFDKVYELVENDSETVELEKNGMWKLFNPDGELVLEMTIDDKETENRVIDFLMTVGIGLDKKIAEEYSQYKFCNGGNGCKFAPLCERYIGNIEDVVIANMIEKNTNTIDVDECVSNGYKYFSNEEHEIIG